MENQFILQKFDSGMHYFMITDIIVETILLDNNKRAICKINNQTEFHCAIMPKKEGGFFVNVGSKICKQLDLKAGSNINATFEIDPTSYQFEMPIEFESVLVTDEIANEIFHKLTIGNQRSLIYLITQVKSTDKKIERSLKISEKLKQGICSAKLVLK